MTTMTDEQKRIRGYSKRRAQAAPGGDRRKGPRGDGRLRAAAVAVPPARFAEAPAPGEWSANEVMAHVVDAGSHFGEGILHALDGRPPGERRHADEQPAAPSHPATEWLADARPRPRGAVRSAPCAPTRGRGSSSRSPTASSACSTGAKRCCSSASTTSITRAQLEKIGAALGARA